MRAEISAALFFGKDIDEAARGVKDKLTRRQKEKFKIIDADVLTAKLIMAGMKEPVNSTAHKLAASFMDDFSRLYDKTGALSDAEAEILKELMQDPLDIDKEETNDGTEADETGTDES